MCYTFYLSSGLLFYFVVVTAASTRDTMLVMEMTCKHNGMCPDNQYCTSNGICECKPGAVLLGKHCIMPVGIGKSCFSVYQCQEYSTCSDRKVCECQPNTVMVNSKCTPTEKYQPPTVTPTNIKLTERVKENDGGTLAMTVVMVIIIVVLTFAAAYELTKVKKYITKSQNRYKKTEVTSADIEAEDEVAAMDPPPEYHTVVQKGYENSNALTQQ